MSGKEPVRVVISGAAGQIGYSLIPLVASGRVFGEDQPVILHLFDLPRAAEALRGVAMEVDDCSYPLIRGVEQCTEAAAAFKGVHYAFLVGGFPRLKGMQRSDLLDKNSPIFEEHGRALNDHADRNVKVLVVANPANTNCLVAALNAPDLPKKNFTAMTRLDANRARSQVALRLGANVTDVRRIVVWGNHSNTMYPSVEHGTLAGEPLAAAIAEHADWVRDEFTPTVQGRGAAIIAARGFGSALSAANAAADHMRDWVHGTPEGEYASMGVFSDGSYGVPEGIIYSFPCVCKDGDWTIVQGLEVSESGRAALKVTADELVEERAHATAPAAPAAAAE